MTFSNTLDINPLLQHKGDICISIYMPAHRGGPQTQQDPIRLRNLLGQAATKMVQAEIDTEEINRLLSPARELLENSNSDFWQHQSDGLALFIGDGFFQYQRVPVDFNEFVSVSHSFYIKPLLPLWTTNGSYYILAVSQNQVRVFEATRSSVEPMSLEAVPNSLAEALKYDDPEKQLQFHSSRGDTPIYHGQGASARDDRTDILRFLRAIDGGLKSSLTSTHRPMVFVGVDYLFPMYQQISSYPTLLDTPLATNPDSLSPQDLHQQTWPMAEAHFSQALKQNKARYLELAGSNYTSSSLKDILNAAHDGQIDTLFVVSEHQKWGIYDAQSRQFAEADGTDPRSDGLLNLAAVYTLHCGGQVFVTGAERMPTNTLAAAILRYPMPKKTAAV